MVTAAERQLIHRELGMQFKQSPSVPAGLFLHTWRTGPQADKPKLSGQFGKRPCRLLDNVGEVVGIPSCSFASVLEAHDRLGLVQQIKRHVLDGGHADDAYDQVRAYAGSPSATPRRPSSAAARDRGAERHGQGRTHAAPAWCTDRLVGAERMGRVEGRLLS